LIENRIEGEGPQSLEMGSTGIMPGIVRHVCWGLVAIVFGATAAGAQERSWAERVFEKLDHDFGVVARGSDAKYRLKMVNPHPDPVHVSGIGLQCVCAQARVSHETLAPGETGYLEISFDTRKFKHNKDTTITVHFDRPVFASVRIPVKAYIRTDVVLTPGSVDFGSAAAGSSTERKIGIAYAGRPNWNITRVISKSKHIETKLQETGRNGGAVSYDLVVTLAASTPVGEIREQLLLVTDDPANPQIPLLVEGRVEADYSVNLELADFGNLAPGARKTVNVVVRGRKPFTIEKIESESTAGMFEVRLPKEPRSIQILPFTIIAPMKPGTILEEFTLTIPGAPHPLTFKAQCKVVGETASRP
jgi:Protein of unknown function (DUF1573)